MYFIEASSVLPDGAINYAHLEHYHQVNWRKSSFQVLFVIILATRGSLESGHFIVKDHFDLDDT